jgi:L-lactate dehydrogenase complex protein LldG
MSAEDASTRERAPNLRPVREFLGRLRERTANIPTRTPLPQQPLTDLRAVSPADDLVRRLVAAAEAAGCRAYRATEETWPAVIADILCSRSVRQAVVEVQPETALTTERAAVLCAALSKIPISTTPERDDETLFSVDAAVTGVQSAVAETGTIVCTSGAASARGSSLIPPLHIALVAESQIVADLFDAFTSLSTRPALPANLNLISGPSKTADIEGVLVTGVHGPGEVHIVVLAGEGAAPAEPQRVA